jgi:hypothetical protein
MSWLNDLMGKTWHRVIAFIATLLLVEIALYRFDHKEIFSSVSNYLENPHRTSLVWGFCIVVCSFHYFYVVLEGKESSKFFVKTSNDFLDLVSAFTTYAVVMNSSLRVLSGIIKEFIGQGKIFVNANTLDFYTILASNFLPIIWIFSQLVNLLIITINFKSVEIKKPSIEPPSQ